MGRVAHKDPCGAEVLARDRRRSDIDMTGERQPVNPILPSETMVPGLDLETLHAKGSEDSSPFYIGLLCYRYILFLDL